MHKKSFTFGLGVGLLFVTAIFYLLAAVMQPQAPLLSDEQIRQHVESQGYLIVSQDALVDLVTEMSIPVAHLEATTDISASEASAEEVVMAVDTAPGELSDSEVLVVLDDPNTDETTAGEATLSTDLVPITVTIPPHMVASQISNLLYLRGVIDDPEVFTSFLIEAGYTTRLRFGQFDLYPDMSHQALLHLLAPVSND